MEAVNNVAANKGEPAFGPGARYLLTFASLIVVIAGVRAADTIIIPILLAVFIAVLSLPLLHGLQQWGLPRILAVVATVLADIAILSAVGFLVVRSVDEFTGQLPGYQANLEQATNSVVQWISERGGPIEAADFLDAERVVGLVGGAVTRVAAVLQNALLVILITVFILFEATSLPTKLRLAFGEGGDRFDRWTRTAQDVQHYLGIKTVVGVVKGCALPSKRGRFGWKRLRRVGNFTWHIGVDINRTLFDRPDRLTGCTVKDVGKSLLRHFGHRIDRPTVDDDRDQVRRRREVVVPQPVMHPLEMPLTLTGSGV